MKPPEVPTPGMAGGENEKAMPSRNLAELAIDVLLDLLELLVAGFALVPRLQSYKEKAVVTGADEAEQAEADDAGRVLNARSVSENVFDFARDFIRALKGSCIWQLEVDVEIALVFVGKEAGRNFGAEETGSGAESTRSIKAMALLRMRKPQTRT